MEENRDILAFLEQLASLNRELANLFNTGNVALLSAMNSTIKEMYRLQHGKEDDAFRTIEPSCEIIYRNFDMIISVLRTTEDGVIDKGAETALNKLLHNIAEACADIAALFGLI